MVALINLGILVLIDTIVSGIGFQGIARAMHCVVRRRFSPP